jgi:putative NIF3 family GTP cyclohydrolase 1 type 2
VRRLLFNFLSSIGFLNRVEIKLYKILTYKNLNMKSIENSGYLISVNNRRKFITTTSIAVGSMVLLSSPLLSFANGFIQKESITVGEIMDLFIAEVPDAPIDKTVDTLKSGSRDIVVTGIVTSMFATIEVIKKAIELGANFIIAHEPTFYNHADDTDWLENDEVYEYKAHLLKRNNIAVWRNHDYIHRHDPDGVFKGLVSQLGWTNFYDVKKSVATVPQTTLKGLIEHAKIKLGIPAVRYIGALTQPCKKVLLMPGAAGGRRQITNIGKEKPDVLLCGELQEWETAEYVRDARAMGQQLSLVVLGHIASEEAGSEYMVSWLKEKVPGVRATHVPAKNSLSFL